MRIVIVEDEPRTREGLIQMIGKYTRHEIRGVAANGAEALPLVRSVKPDLVLTDIQMPDMNGLTMLEHLADMPDKPLAIILTGYASFEYARTAVHLGVVDYVLKPIDVPAFLSLLEETEKKLESQKMEQVGTTQLLWEYLSADPAARARQLPGLLRQLQVSADADWTAFLIQPAPLEPDVMGQETVGLLSRHVQEKMEGCCSRKCHLVNLPCANGLLLLVQGANTGGMLACMFSDAVLPELQKICRCACACVPVAGIEKLGEAMDALQALLPATFVYGMGRVLDPEMVRRLSYSPIPYPLELENRMRKEILAGEYAKARKLGQRFRETVMEGDSPPDLIREYTARLASAIYNIAKERNLQAESQPIYHRYIHRMVESRTREELAAHYERFLRMVLGDLTEANEEMDVDSQAILKVIHYIREQYGSNVTLSDAAQLIGVTPEYLSRLFYQKINVNFVVFLRDFRVSVAKRMLLSGKYRIQEIAEHVGFKDPKYFNKVFKSVCGVSPSEYKKVM